MESNVPPIRDGDTVEIVHEGEIFTGTAIVDPDNELHGFGIPVLVDIEVAVVLPDPRYPVLLLKAAAAEPTWSEAVADFERQVGRRATDAERDVIREILEDREAGLSGGTGMISAQFVANVLRNAGL